MSLLPRREDTQIPLCVSCQDFFRMCQTTLLVFAGGVGLYLYYIVISVRVALPCLFFPLIFSLFSLLGIQRVSMSGGRLINILPAALGRVLGTGVAFLVRPLCCIVMGGEQGTLGRSWGGCGQLTSLAYLPQECSWGCHCSLGLAWPSNCLEVRNSEKWVLGESGAGDSLEFWLPLLWEGRLWICPGDDAKRRWGTSAASTPHCSEALLSLGSFPGLFLLPGNTEGCPMISLLMVQHRGMFSKELGMECGTECWDGILGQE